MTKTSRFNAYRYCINGLFALAAAASLAVRPLAAQSLTPRDSALLTASRRGKATSDSIATQVAPGFAQFCSSGFKGMGYVKQPCSIFAGLLARDRAADSTLVALASIPGPTSHVDTLRLAVHDTTRITTTVIKHDTVTKRDTVFVTQTPTTPVPTPVAVASLSTSLSDRALTPGETTTASVAVKDASGKVITGRAPQWSSGTPSVATVSSSGVVTAIAAGTSAIRATIDDKSSYATVTVTAPAPDTTASTKPIPTPTVDPSKASAVLSLVGPTIAASSVPTSAAFYEKNFKAATDAQWAAFGPQWDAGNSISGYERAAIYYTWWARTGDTTYLSRAHQTAVNYRDNYLIPANYGTSPHWSQMESLYLDWTVMGDTKSRDAVLNVGNVWIAFLMRSPGTQSYLTSQSEGRQRARIMISEWMVEKLTGTRNQWLDSAIVQTLSTLNTQGFAPDVSTCGGSLNYMGGMVMDALTRLHDQRANNWNAAYNAAIETKALAFGNYLWSTQWRGAADPSFNYVSLLCDGTGSPTSAPDLNGLILPTFGWLGKQTGNAIWFTRGDSVLSGMQGAYLDGYRQTSESYSSSFRYFGYRYPTLVLKATAPTPVMATARRANPLDVTKTISTAVLARMTADSKRTRAMEAAQHDSIVARRIRKP